MSSAVRVCARLPRKLIVVLFPLLLCCFSRLNAQQPAGAGTRNLPLPESPEPKGPPSSSPLVDTTSRFVGYMTNRSIFFPDIASSPGPPTPTGKFRLFIDQSVSPAYVLIAGTNAAYGQARDVPQGYGQGWNSYAERFGAQMARGASNSFFGSFAFASLLRQDPRFFPQSRPTFWGSVKYSAWRIAETRTDSGGQTFNSSGILGPFAGEVLANAYLPRTEQTGAKTAERFGVDLAWKFAGHMFKNYWPTFFHDMGLNRLKVIPDPGLSQPTPAD
jgi:hypothetical protein